MFHNIETWTAFGNRNGLGEEDRAHAHSTVGGVASQGHEVQLVGGGLFFGTFGGLELSVGGGLFFGTFGGINSASHGPDEATLSEGQLGDDGSPFLQDVLVPFAVVRHWENDLKKIKLNIFEKIEHSPGI